MINMLIYSRNPWRNNMNIMRPEIRGHKKDPDRTSRDDTKAKPKTTPHGTNSWLEMMSKTSKTKEKSLQGSKKENKT